MMRVVRVVRVYDEGGDDYDEGGDDYGEDGEGGKGV